jgi:hypothetical protein
VSERELKRRVRRLFRCGCRLSVFDGGASVFVILRRRRSTRQDLAEHGTFWAREIGGEPVHYDYFVEHVMANGKGCAGAWKSAQNYHRVGGRRPGEIENERKPQQNRVKINEKSY